MNRKLQTIVKLSLPACDVKTYRMLLIWLPLLFFTLNSPASQISVEQKETVADSITAQLTASEPDSIATDSLERELPVSLNLSVVPRNESPDWWINRIKDHTYNIYDTTVVYPKFMNFCVDIYRWGNKTFNTYDNDYVLPTGKNWKVMLRNLNLTDSYSMHFSPNISIRMLSNVYASLGAYVSFMAVSVGYSINLSKLLGLEYGAQKRFDFNFNTALFTVDAYYNSNNGGTIIRRFSDYDSGKWIHVDFPDLKLKTYGVDAYYFLNNKRYSQGAVYNFSKYQIKSQGSWIFGFSISHNSIKMDFSSINYQMQELLPDDQRKYNFIYNDFSLLAGYGFNWVMAHNWVYNITVLPAFGLKHTFPESVEGSKTRVSLGVRGRTGVVYNMKNLYLGIEGQINGHWHINPGFYFFNSFITFGANVGFRF